jgi:hypothetical protein
MRLVNGVRLLCYEGKQVQLPDSKGLGDIATLIGAHGADVHVLILVGHRLARMGADPVLDEKAKAAYKARLAGLAGKSRTRRTRAAPGEPRRCAQNATRSSASSPRPPDWAAGTESSAMRPNGRGRPSAPGSGTPWPRSGRYTPN